MKIPVLLLSFLFSFSLFSQKNIDGNCAASEAMERKFSLNPELKKAWERAEKKALTHFSNPTVLRKRTAPFVLPVVVHVIHNGGMENIPDTEVLQAIDNLNAAFANTGYYDPNTGVDTEIQFCLAKRAPNNEVTTGINRVRSSLTEFDSSVDDQTLKDLSRWEQLDYINIWVVKEICSQNGCGVAGYAYFPSAHGQPFDGIVVESGYFGSAPENSSVLVHEMGHYLGLYHTFQGGCGNVDCLTDGDRVCDTPPDNTTARVPCNAPSNSCSTDTQSGFSTDQPDMINNYMDYSDLSCYNAFTMGQKERMAFFIENTRQSLLNSAACIDPCNMPVIAGFNVSQTEITEGQTLNFTNTSANASDFIWKINGVRVSSGTDFSQLFSTLGNFRITLVAISNLPDCLPDSISTNILVTCSVEANFNSSHLSQIVDGTISFQNLSSNANSYNWTVNGTDFGSNRDLDLSQSSLGVFVVCLTAQNDFCDDEKCVNIEFSGTTADCSDSEIVIIGTPDNDEYGGSMILSPDGNLLMVGRYNNQSFISKITFDGTLIWSKKLELSQHDHERTHGLIIDSNGFLVGAGEGIVNGRTPGEGFIFKFDLNTQELVWRGIFEGLHTNYDMHQMPNGNYLIGGDVLAGWSDAVFTEVNQYTGTIVRGTRDAYHVGNNETLLAFSFNSGRIIGSARYALGNDFGTFRGVLSSFSMSGQEQWTKSYLVPPNANARLYIYDFLIERNNIYAVMYGELSGNTLNNSDLIFMECSLDGDLKKAIHYDLPGNHLFMNGIYSTDKYFFLDVVDRRTNQIILTKTDKQGKIIYSMRIPNWRTTALLTNSAIIAGAHLYMVKTIINNGSEDIVLIKIPIEGRPDFGGCINPQFVNFTERTMVNPYQGNMNVTTRSATSRIGTSPISISDVAMDKDPICQEPCIEDCSNGIDDDGDGLVDCEDPDCPCFDNCLDKNIPDARMEIENVACSGENISIEFTICNIGRGILLARTPVLFYAQDPRLINSPPIFNYQLPEQIEIDKCSSFKIEIPNPGNGEIFILANADHSTPPPYDLASDFPITPTNECDFTNNIASIPIDFVKNYLVDLGPDVTVCPDQAYVLSATSNYPEIRWSDGSTESTITVYESGKYWACVQDDCGNRACDTVEISLDNSFLFDLGNDLEICQGEEVTITTSGFQNQDFQWFPNDNLPCDDCPSVTFMPDETIIYSVIGTASNGCISTDEIIISVNAASEVFDTIKLCRGDTIQYEGVDFFENGDRVFQHQNRFGCDSTLSLNLAVGDTFNFAQKISICENEEADVFGNMTNVPGIYVENYQTALGCDSSYMIELEVKKFAFSDEEITICEKDSALIFGVFREESGVWSQSDLGANGCDSLHEIKLVVNPSYAFFDTLKLCAGDDFDFHGTSVSMPGNYSFPAATARGCDSIFHLTAIAARDTARNFSVENICEGDTISVFGNAVFENGIYTQIDDDGLCVKLTEVEVLVNQQPETFDTISTCAGSPVSIFGNQIDLADTYFETFNSARFCDSTHAITLEIRDTFSFFNQVFICQNEAADIFGTMTDVPGFYHQNLQTAAGCDSNFTIELIVRDTLKTAIPISICEKDSIEIFGSFEHLSGVYSQTFSSVNGCDSLHSIELSLNPIFDFFDTLQICVGDTIDFFGTPIFEQGDFQHYEQTRVGCDSIFNLKIIPARDTAFSAQNENICPGDTIIVFGNEVFENGIFTEIDDDGFCVSVKEIAVNLGEISQTFDTISTCLGSPLLIFGNQTDVAGTYPETYNRFGKCDSIYSITLNARDTFYDFKNLQICSGETTAIFGNLTSVPGIYSKNYTAQNGCDSLAVVKLEVADTLRTEDVFSICKNDSILIFGNYESVPGSYSQSAISDAGCDSVHVVSLQNFPDFQFMIFAEKACFEDSSGMAAIQTSPADDFEFLWENGSREANISDLKPGIYRFTVTDENGCPKTDSVLVENESFEIVSDDLPPLCFGGTNGSIEIISAATNLEFKLNDGVFSTQNTFENLSSGNYSIAIRNSNNCILKTEIELSDPELLTVSLPGDTILNLGDSIQLIPNSNGFPTGFTWQPDIELNCPDCPTVVARPQNSITYFLEIANANGCLAFDSIHIEILSDNNYFIPSAFSPNGDGNNDFFMIYGNSNLEKIKEFAIFDRWGELIWKGENLQPNINEFGWDGKFRDKEMNSNVFAFYVVLEFINGETVIEKGDVTLTR